VYEYVYEYEYGATPPCSPFLLPSLPSKSHLHRKLPYSYTYSYTQISLSDPVANPPREIGVYECVYEYTDNH